MRAALLSLLALALSGCPRVHELQDGEYTFALDQVLRDDCGLAQQPAVLGKGVLHTTGNTLRIDYSYLHIQLVGTYLVLEERLTCDGSTGNVSTTVRTQECLLDTVSIHLEGTAQSPTSMAGSMSVTYDARQPDACVCKFWLTWTATKT